MNEKYYWYTGADGKKVRIRSNGEPGAEGVPFVIDNGEGYEDNGMPIYLRRDEVNGLEEAEGQGSRVEGQGSRSEDTGGVDFGMDDDGIVNFDFGQLADEAPDAVQLSDSDWLASLAPDAKKRERSLKSRRAIDALNMVSQAVQVLGRLGNTSLGAGNAQPMSGDAYSKYMDRVYQQGMQYENTLAARQKIMNAGKKLQQDYNVKVAKMQLEQQKYQAQLRRQAAKDKKEIEYWNKRIAKIQADIDSLNKLTDARITHYRTQDSVAQQRAADSSTVAASTAAKNNALANKYKNGTTTDTSATEQAGGLTVEQATQKWANRAVNQPKK